ncbi:MAG: hypothetical protein CM15mP17_16260 [Gammaproteobacteria bacterium]|nr:MAG: hypothetical protein CM15mP17_16260 [Gammaproteobacteria bacterium]
MAAQAAVIAAAAVCCCTRISASAPGWQASCTFDNTNTIGSTAWAGANVSKIGSDDVKQISRLLRMHKELE